ncbi:MAG: DNA polymerase I [Eubacteriales bacterium]|nr:DNA polymerase I [Eubacteriales bacterium]
MSEKILLIDGHSILNRAFYGLPDLTNAEGKHTGAVYGFLNMMFRMVEEEQPEYITVAFDLHAPTFRHIMYEQYKGTRKGMPEELREQVPLIQEVLKAMNINIMTLEGYEADDLIGTIARKSEKMGMKVTIFSGDRDLLQLATDKVTIRLPKTSKGKTTIEDFGWDQVVEKYQVTPPQIIELKALMGDSSDNIPGLPGVGEKTAVKILAAFENIEQAYEHYEEIKPNKAKEAMRDHYDLAVLSKKLATINTESPVAFSYDDARRTDPYTQKAYELCKRLEFKNLLNKFDQTVGLDHKIEEQFFTCTDLAGVEVLFDKAKSQEIVGVSAAVQGTAIYGAAVALSTEEVYFVPVEGLITEHYLKLNIKELSQNVKLCTMDGKALIKACELEDDSEILDLSVAAYLLNPLKSTYTYEDLAKEYMGGLLVPAREDLLGKKTFEKAWNESDPALATYCSYDACIAINCCISMEQRLKEEGMWEVYTEIELPLIYTLVSMENYGIRVQGDALKNYGEQLNVRIVELEVSICEQAGEKFNINSPKQLGVILFEKLGIPGGKKTKTGYSTAADILEKLAPEQPIINDILEYRQLTKLKSTYADGLANEIREDGRIHSTFNQTITATGRISSTEPNLQNIPVRMELGRMIRKVFVPEEQYVFLDADYSQIELRVLAHMSGDEKLIQAYREAQDIHRITASQVFHIPFEEVTPLQRRNAKAVNFGIVYGISSFGLSQDLSISRKEAAEYIERYFETYPKIKGFLDGLVEEGKEKGYVTTMYGRRRPIPELKSSNFMQRSFGERVAMNSPIQGTAADIIKIAMNRVYQRLKQENLRSRLILQVHDELLIEAHIDEVETVSHILIDEMKNAASLAVELEVDMHQGNNWYEAK